MATIDHDVTRVVRAYGEAMSLSRRYAVPFGEAKSRRYRHIAEDNLLKLRNLLVSLRRDDPETSFRVERGIDKEVWDSIPWDAP